MDEMISSNRKQPPTYDRSLSQKTTTTFLNHA